MTKLSTLADWNSIALIVFALFYGVSVGAAADAKVSNSNASATKSDSKLVSSLSFH